MIAIKVTDNITPRLLVKYMRLSKQWEMGLKAAGRFVLEESQKIVPYDTGALHDSGKTYDAGRGGWKTDVVIQYGGPELEAKSKSGYDYALIQHETPPPIYTHPAPRRYKYIESVVREQLAAIVKIVAAYTNVKTKGKK